MCARLSRLAASVVVAGFVLAACGGSERTGTAFCRRVAEVTPRIGLPVTTKSDASRLVESYENLLEVAPLTIEKDLRTVTDLLRQASKVDTKNAEEVQALADASYAANQSALNVRDWVKSTCAVDISTGLTIAPPRTVPPTTSSTVPAAATTLPPASGATTTTAAG